MIYFTSDLHFCHDKDFIYGPRGFKSVGEMNDAIIKNWNSIVTPADTVYVLGDIMLKDNKNGLKCWEKLVGKKCVILGNHDSNPRVDCYRNSPDTEILGYAVPFKYGKYHFYLSHYPSLTANYDQDDPLSMQVINLCGHTHTKDRFSDMDKGLIYHVELDAHDNKPVSIDKILEDIKKYRGG